ncbi:Asx homology domain-domain-containing protein [Clohesyomyces aquaticus]|uniref:Asx homology domain-domain-containing protein n=1 Tax=Clohesyomyces aquaticus TaxID=1231657 RepID=A0A1Y1ZJX8_9PLEO|nr:Asx homology domain-domain-containing protein [Clohesyomyces aquaticus]
MSLPMRSLSPPAASPKQHPHLFEAPVFTTPNFSLASPSHDSTRTSPHRNNPHTPLSGSQKLASPRDSDIPTSPKGYELFASTDGNGCLPTTKMGVPHSTVASPVVSSTSSPISDVTPSPSSAISGKRRCVDDVDNDQDSVPAQKKRNKATPKSKASPKPTATATPTPTRPTRNRKAPERFTDMKEPAKKKTETVAPKSGKRAFDPTFLTTNSKSRLVTADLYHLLLDPEAWNVLGASNQASLLKMLPGSQANRGLLAQIADGAKSVERPANLGGNCAAFRTDVKKWQDDLGEGYLTKTWQDAAEKAMKARAAGDFDAWKEDEGERWWGQKGE